MTLPINDQLDSIFGIPKDGTNIKDSDDTQETSYAEVIVADEDVKFEQKAKQLSDQLAKDAPLVNVVYTSKEEEPINVQSQQSVAAPIEQKRDQFEEILSQSVRFQQPIIKEVQPVVQESTINNKNAESEKEDENSVQDGDVITNGSSSLYEHKMDADGWYLNPPSPMFKHFYEEKASFIRHITRNGRPLDIDKLNAELKSSTISTNVELMDVRGMSDKLNIIQSLMDRVVHIKIQATGQCASAKRGVELLRGVLAKVSYEKPAARQDGVIYDHMRDIEMYASQLESLEQNAKDVYHNILEAKEILSRKISIFLELMKEQNRTDGLEKAFGNLPENVKRAAIQQPSQAEVVATKNSRLANEGYDRLEVQEVVKAQSTKPKEPMKKSGTFSFLD